MRGALRIASREFRATFGSAYGWGLTAGYLAIAGIMLVFALRPGEARLDGWFGPLFLLTGVLAPLLTMRAFAEEERSGSLELLLTAPVRTTHVVLGKLLGITAVYSVLVVGTLACPFLLASMGDPDGGPIGTGYIGLVLVGVAFASVGLATSAGTPSQLVAASAAAGLLLALWFAGGISSGLTGRTRVVLDYLSPSSHVTGFLRGTLAITDIAYFLSMAVVGVGSAVVILRIRR
jgi:ABC-2 type transport system permease protein